MKKIITAIALTAALAFGPAATAATFGDWESSQRFDLISTYVPSLDGDMQVSIHKSGSIQLSMYPVGWQDDGNLDPVQSWPTVMTVNGQPVKFTMDKLSSGSIHAHPTTYKGQEYVKAQFWKSNRVAFTLSTGETGYFSAKGVQAAWADLTAKGAI